MFDVLACFGHRRHVSYTASLPSLLWIQKQRKYDGKQPGRKRGTSHQKNSVKIKTPLLRTMPTKYKGFCVR